MVDNPCIPAIARLLRSHEPPGALAKTLFEHYDALPSNDEKAAYVIALIGELLVVRAKQMSDG
jgi:hypothetical protein